ncbi:MAG: hypothetical protein GF329_18920 [Candidatus Lokiarchaeota archaeon]|nr:hypothetical protein [Candidatus Lokiarchaeota archaeon]
MSYENVKIKKEQVKKKKPIEKSNKRRKQVILVIIVGLCLALLSLIFNYSQQYLWIYFTEKNALGLIDVSVLNNYEYQIDVNIMMLRVFWVSAGFLTIVALIVGALSPFGGKGTPYFSEYVRLGLIVCAGVIFYVMFVMTDQIFILTW